MLFRSKTTGLIADYPEHFCALYEDLEPVNAPDSCTSCKILPPEPEHDIIEDDAEGFISYE